LLYSFSSARDISGVQVSRDRSRFFGVYPASRATSGSHILSGKNDQRDKPLQLLGFIGEVYNNTFLFKGHQPQGSRCRTDQNETRLVRKCVMENAQTALDQDEYRERYNALSRRYETAKARLDELSEAKNDCVAQRESIRHFLAEVSARGEVVTRFDVEVFCAAVERVIVHEKRTLVVFKNGSEIPVDVK